jgi:hypothetical protein
LNEGLELIAGVSGCTLETEDLFNGLLSHNGISQAIGYVRELLLLSPLYVPLKALIVIVVMSVLSIGEGLLVVDLLSLGEPGASGLPPSVVEIEEHVVKLHISVTDWFDLIEVRRNVADFTEVLWSNLTDVKIDHMAVVSINLSDLVLGKILCVEPVLDVHVLVRKNNWRVAVMVARGLGVKDLEVLRNFVLINLEEEVRLGLDFTVNVWSKALLLFTLKLFLKAKSIQLLLDESGDAVLDLLNVFMIIIIDLANLSKDSLLLLRAAQLSEPFGFSSLLLLLFSEVSLWENLEFLPIRGGFLLLDFGSLGSLCSLDKGLDWVEGEASLICWLEQAREEGLLGCRCYSLEEHIFLRDI